MACPNNENGEVAAPDDLDTTITNESLTSQIEVAEQPSVAVDLPGSYAKLATTAGARTESDVNRSYQEHVNYLEANDSLRLRDTMVLLDGASDMDMALSGGSFFDTHGLNSTVIDMSDVKARGDGSDSGIESLSLFQRAFSCNSTGYSSGGFDDFNKSCESSLLSYSEETELMTTSLTMFAGDATSEAGSESSNAADISQDSKPKLSTHHKSAANTKKNILSKVMKENSNTPLKTTQSPASAGRQRPSKSPIPPITSRPTPNSSKKDRTTGPNTPSEKTSLKTSDVASKTNSGLKSKVTQSSRVTSSTPPRAKTPKIDDGRWPSSTNRAPLTPRPRRAQNVETKKPNDVSRQTSTESRTTMDIYGTLPRRSRKKSPDISRELTRSVSVNREPMAKRYHRNVREVGRSVPPVFRRRPQRTKIYHETSIQTALTGADIEKALDGMCIKEPCLKVEKQDQEIQVDEENNKNPALENEFKKLKEENETLKNQVDSQKGEMEAMEGQLSEEKEAKEKVQEEMRKTELRILAMLGKYEGDTIEKSLQELELHLLTLKNNIIIQQKEIKYLQAAHRKLQYDLEKGLADHKTVLQQQRDAEVESLEMQDFLQAEKTMLAESLRDTEAEVVQLKEALLQKEHELESKQEECKHLVRISEQRRQEALTLQARLSRLEQRSKDLLLQQGATVSGAAVALSGLSSRLDGLVDQLVTSYDISEKDLEDVIFHNEAYSKSNSSSIEASPERKNFHPPMSSPKRRASFLSAVVKAICNATSQPHIPAAPDHTTANGVGVLTVNDSLFIEDTEEKSGSCKSSPENRLVNSESLQNLTQAILTRQRLEDENRDTDSVSCDIDDELLPDFTDYTPGSTFVDQIIDVDNLVTKLLKVIRIIQLENDSTVEMLQEDRLKLEAEIRKEQDLRRSTQEDVRNWELLGARLRGEVQEAQLQLKRKVEQLEEVHADLQTHQEQVGMLNNEITSLTTARRQLRDCESEVKRVFENWQLTGELPSPDSIAWIIAAHNEIPDLKKQLEEKEHRLKEMEHKHAVNNEMLSQNLCQAASEIRRQYEAIDNALEVLQNIQSIVVQCPPLSKLQRELEETNFHCASTLPVVAADLNANAPFAMSNGVHNNEIDLSQAVL